ncbi:MAG TPA: glycosyltransferase [bacterium]|nr:glycosyltransferase [bacterium]
MLKLALISDYPPYKCGIANYTRYLAHSLNRSGLFDMCVISEGGRQDDTFPVYDVYSRNGNYRHDIMKKIAEIKPDAVHIQHALVLFPDTVEFLKMIKELSDLNIKVFVTLHTADTGRNRRIDWEKFYRTVLECGHIIVHNEMCLNSIRYYDLPTEKVHIIPHGTAFLELPDRVQAREKLELPADEFIFLILGFIHLLKNHHTVISAFRTMRSQKKCRLLIAGMADQNKWYNHLYVTGCRLLSLFSKNIVWHSNFIKNDDLPYYLAASDVMLMPYWQNYPSASGIFHLTIGAKLPVICSDSVKFSEVKHFIKENDIFIPTFSISKWKNSMSKFADRPDLLKKITEKLFDYAQETSWHNVAIQHADIFQEK